MGFFSWNTADTKQSIPNKFSNEETKTVYLLQPDRLPLVESAYEGYGVFGGTDAYEWLAIENYGDKKYKKLAITVDCGGRFIIHNELYYVGSKSLPKEDAEMMAPDKIEKLRFFESYDDIIPNSGNKTVNMVIESRECEFEKFPPFKYPLKFSFKPTARYDALPASEQCEHQGYFY